MQNIAVILGLIVQTGLPIIIQTLSHVVKEISLALGLGWFYADPYVL